MRHRWSFLFALAVCALAALAGSARAAQSPADLLSVLAAEGFENLSVQKESDGGGIRIAFENRRYRWDVTGLGVLLAKASAEQEGRLVVVPLHTGVPMARIEVEAADYRAFVRGEMSEDEIFSRMTVTNRVEGTVGDTSNSSYGKVDLTFAPGVRLNLVTPAPPGTFHGGELRLNPGVYAGLWRGLTFDGTYSYPLSSNKPKIARAAATANARAGEQGYVQAQAGRLSEDLDGFVAHFSYQSQDGRHHVGLTGAYAGYPEMERSASYQFAYSWRPLPEDVVLTASMGRFLAGDQGYTLGLVSGFGETSVEFFWTKTDASRVLGAGFTVPLGWSRQPYPGPVRLRFRNAFRFLYTDERPLRDGGLFVPTSDGYQVAMRRLNRAYLRAYASRLREAGLKALPAESSKPGM